MFDIVFLGSSDDKDIFREINLVILDENKSFPQSLWSKKTTLNSPRTSEIPKYVTKPIDYLFLSASPSVFNRVSHYFTKKFIRFKVVHQKTVNISVRYFQFLLWFEENLYPLDYLIGKETRMEKNLANFMKWPKSTSEFGIKDTYVVLCHIYYCSIWSPTSAESGTLINEINSQIIENCFSTYNELC